MELSEQTGTLLENLETRIQDLRAVLETADLGPYSSTVELLVRALAEEFTDTRKSSSSISARRRDGDPIISWRELHNILSEGSEAEDLPLWAIASFRQVSSILRGEAFPCIFARQANYLKSGWVCFVDSVETEEGRELVKKAILAYYGVIKRFPRERTIIMPLLIMVKPVYPHLALEDYREQAWGLFNWLHENDPEPWPLDIPTDPDRDDWTYCFGGIQLFSNVSMPAHKVHIARNLGDSLCFVTQPRTNFDLVGGNNRKGRLVRQEIRERSERYEGRPVSKALAHYGTSSNRDWMQMASPDSDDDSTYPKVCPFKFRGRDHDKKLAAEAAKLAAADKKPDEPG